jgi:hypothetical protein
MRLGWGEVKVAHKILMGKTYDNCPLGRPRRRWRGPFSHGNTHIYYDMLIHCIGKGLLINVPETTSWNSPLLSNGSTSIVLTKT